MIDVFTVGGGQFGLAGQQFKGVHGGAREIHAAQRSASDGHTGAQQPHSEVAERVDGPHRSQSPSKRQ